MSSLTPVVQIQLPKTLLLTSNKGEAQGQCRPPTASATPTRHMHQIYQFGWFDTPTSIVLAFGWAALDQTRR